MVVGPRGLGNSPLRRPGEDRTGVALVGGPGVVPSDLGVLYLAVVWLLVLPVFHRGDSSPGWDWPEAFIWAVRQRPAPLRADFIFGALIWVIGYLRVFCSGSPFCSLHFRMCTVYMFFLCLNKAGDS